MRQAVLVDGGRAVPRVEALLKFAVRCGWHTSNSVVLDEEAGVSQASVFHGRSAPRYHACYAITIEIRSVPSRAPARKYDMGRSGHIESGHQIVDRGI